VKLFYLLYDAAVRFSECGAGYYAAAFSYYAPLALIPLLFVSITIVGSIYGDTFTAQVFSNWGSVLGEDLVNIINLAVSNVDTGEGSSKFTIIGTVFFLSICIFALNVMSDGFEDLWGIQRRGFRAWLFKSFRSIGFIFILQVYLIFIIGLEFFIAPTLFGESTFISSLILFVSTTIFFATLYRILPVHSPTWWGCLVGAVIASLLFVAAKNLVYFYIATTPVIALYGAAGLILILLIWVFILAIIIFYGAAVSGLYDKINKSNVSTK
jgi:membrane protein